MNDPALSLVGGQFLTVDVARRLAPGEVIRLMVDQPSVRPVDVGDIVEVVPGDGARPGETVLYAHDGRCELARLIRPIGDGVEIEVGPAGRRIRLPAGAVLGVATALEQGDLLFELSHGRWRAAGRAAAALPPRMGRVLGFMARLERLRRPFFPPLVMGDEQDLLTQLTRAYDVESEIIDRESALLPEEHVLLERVLTRGGRVLDVGCGAGREAVGFACAGLEVVGIDLAPAMIARARERARAAGLSIEFAVGEPLTWTAAGGPFDAIYFSPGLYSHIPGRARRVRTLARLRGLLARGGLIVLGPILSPPRPLLSRSRLVDALRRIGRAAGIRRLAEPGDHYHRGHALERPPGSYRYVHRFRNRDEAEAELAEATLRVTDRLHETCWIVRPVT